MACVGGIVGAERTTVVNGPIERRGGVPTAVDELTPNGQLPAARCTPMKPES